MKLASTGTYRGSYQIRLDGAVKFNSDTDVPPSDTDAPSLPEKESPLGTDPMRRPAATEVEFDRRFSADCLPKSGTLSFVMPDGTVKEIKLNGVQKVSHKP